MALSGLNYRFAGLSLFFVTCAISLVLKIYTPVNEAKFPTANITRHLMSSVSVLQRILEPLNNTFPNAKRTTPLYLPVKMAQTHTVTANK